MNTIEDCIASTTNIITKLATEKGVTMNEYMYIKYDIVIGEYEKVIRMINDTNKTSCDVVDDTVDGFFNKSSNEAVDDVAADIIDAVDLTLCNSIIDTVNKFFNKSSNETLYGVSTAELVSVANVVINALDSTTPNIEYLATVDEMITSMAAKYHITAEQYLSTDDVFLRMSDKYNMTVVEYLAAVGDLLSKSIADLRSKSE